MAIRRIHSDYLGSGRFLALEEDGLLVVNADYGVQAIGLDGTVRWRVELVERCLGLIEDSEGSLVASTAHAFHRISRAGEVIDTRPTRHGLRRPPVRWGDGFLLGTRTRIYALDSTGTARWRYRLRKSLGESVKSVFFTGIVPVGDMAAVAAIDQDTGIGRVVVLDKEGELRWQSEPAPITEIFAVGDDSFVYTISGYGRFESVFSDVRGEVRWTKEGGGPGVDLDGRLVVAYGNTEAPTWDDWEVRVLDLDGKLLERHHARGRCCYAPVQGPDGRLYFSSYFRPIDPAESRVDYTSFERPPRLVADENLIAGRARMDYDVFFFQFELGVGIKLLQESQGTYALGPTVAGSSHIFFVHERDILAFDPKSD